MVWPLRLRADGTYTPHVTAHMPDLADLPIHVYARRTTAERALALLVYDCAGTA